MSIFNTILNKKPNYSVQNLSQDIKLSCNMGDLVPIMCQEVIPGDKFNNQSEILLRFQPLLAPIMHQVNVTTHFFFVPNRIIWDGWEEFITGGDNGLSNRVMPYFGDTTSMLSETFAEFRKFAQYFGVNYEDNSYEKICNNVLPFYAYNKIYNDYYRDENLIEPILDKAIDGSNPKPYVNNSFKIRKRAWKHDMFTSALPFAQKGAEINLPMASLNIEFDDNDNPTELVDNNGERAGIIGKTVSGELENRSLFAESGLTGDTNLKRVDNSQNLKVTGDKETTINELRRATRLQEWLERNARGGSRYIEAIKAHFNVNSPDYRLQRPEFLGGGIQNVRISEVLQTSETTDNSAQATMAGHGYSIGGQNTFRGKFTEHGFIIGIMSVTPKPSYMQGVPRWALKDNKFDFAFPEFAQLGEQEIYSQELYNDGESTTFGYEPRYNEYRFSPDIVAGDFKTNLDFWHLGRKFASKPTLSKEFIECNPSNRIFAVTDDNVDHLLCHIINKTKAVRPLPKFNSPTL